jgi:hypothetical protein
MSAFEADRFNHSRTSPGDNLQAACHSGESRIRYASGGTAKIVPFLSVVTFRDLAVCLKADAYTELISFCDFVDARVQRRRLKNSFKTSADRPDKTPPRTSIL